MTFQFLGFRYNTACPVNLVSQLRDCHITELSNHPLAFAKDNDLIAYGNLDDVVAACR